MIFNRQLVQVRVEFFVLKRYVTKTPQPVMYLLRHVFHHCEGSFTHNISPIVHRNTRGWTYVSDCGERPIPVCERFLVIDIQLLELI